MAQTPLTSSTTYLSATQFLLRVDRRTVADLCSDTGTAVDADALAADANLAAALLDASGEVEAAAMKGARYTPSDLAALTGAAQARLFRLITRIALGLLYERRPDKGKPPESYQLALDQLQELRDGVMVFGTVETADAQTMEATTETTQDVEARNGITFISRRFFGRRSNRMDSE